MQRTITAVHGDHSAAGEVRRGRCGTHAGCNVKALLPPEMLATLETMEDEPATLPTLPPSCAVGQRP